MESQIEYQDVIKTTFIAAKHPYWGRGSTPRQACDEYRKAGGRRRSHGGKPKVAVVTWAPYVGEKGDAYVDDFGSIRVPGKFVNLPGCKAVREVKIR